MKTIEVEFRSIFSEEKYIYLKGLLDQSAEDLGEDDKDVFFFILPDKIMKVVDNISKSSGKIVMKLNAIGQGSDFEEIEILIERSDVEKAVKVFKALNITDNVMHSFQKRHNYMYKDVEIALKYSDVWGYHAELEIVVNDPGQKEIAEEKIKAVAKELDISLMSDEELREFTRQAEEKNKKEENLLFNIS